MATRTLDRVGPRLLTHLNDRRDEIVRFISRLAELESPTDVRDSQGPVQDVIRQELESLDYRVRLVPGRETGGHLLARPVHRSKTKGVQLLIGHTDTVWPIGTLEQMPVHVVDGQLRGPGVFDMKGGVTLGIFAVRALKQMGLDPPLSPVFFINSDEEIGSPESRRWVIALAKAADRAFVLEPPMGPRGIIKTARKGVGRFTVTVKGKSAHAGLEPEAGASAILELSYVIQKLHALNDRERGTTVNVGVIDGGVRPNVVAAESRARVDIRVATVEDARRLEAAVGAIRPSVEGTELTIEGGLGVPPLERTERNRALWLAAREVGRSMGLELEEGMAGGGSDGNTTSLHTATLDGLGVVGDGAHAHHEFAYVDRLAERAALLAGLLMAP